MRTALMTKRKSPSEKMVAGNVSITKIGFTKVLSTLRTTETMSAVRRESIAIPGKK